MVEMPNADHAQRYRLIADAISELAVLINLTNTGFNAAVGELIVDGQIIPGLDKDVEKKISDGVDASLELDDAAVMLAEAAELMVRLADMLDPQ